MEQQFSLSWREFQGNLSLGCARLLGSGEFADVTLAAEGQLLQAHRLVLSICSPYFQKMFLANPCQHPIVVLKDVSFRAMKSLLQFMYNGEVSVKQEDLTSFINTAETLEIKGLTNKHNDEETQNTKQANEITPNFKRTDIVDGPHDKLNENNVVLMKNSDVISDKHGIVSHSPLKRKCDNFVQNNCNASSNALDQMAPVEKKTKLREKQILNNKHKILNIHQKKLIPLDNDHCTNETLRSSVDSNKDSFLDYNSRENSNESRFCEEIDSKSIGNSVETVNMIDTDDGDVVVKKENSNNAEYSFEESPIRNETISVRNDLIENQVSRLSPGLDHHGDPAISNAHFILSRKGNRQLVFSNYIHTKYTNNKNMVVWRCIDYYSEYKCKATIVTSNDIITEVRYTHDHQCHSEKIAKAENEACCSTAIKIHPFVI